MRPNFNLTENFHTTETIRWEILNFWKPKETAGNL